MDYSGPFPEEKGVNEPALKRFAKAISPIVLSIRKKDVMDFPKQIHDIIHCDTPEDYLSAAKALAFQESSPITLLHKLRQLSDGFIYREEGTFSQPNSPKELKLKELLEFYLDQEIPRVVIYGGFKESLNKIKEVCRGSGFTVGLSSGGHPVSSDFLSDFASSSSKPLACVANPGCTFGP